LGLNNSLIVVCKAIPFDSGGSAKVVRSLFNNAKEQDHVLLFGREPQTDVHIRDLILPYKWEISPLSNGSENVIIKFYKFLNSLFVGIRIIKKYNSNAILGVYRDETSFILSYLLSIVNRLPLHVYLTDLYAENYSSAIKKWIQNKIFSRAVKIFCINEGMQKIYSDKYNIAATVVPHCVNAPLTHSKPLLSEKGFVILFSGNIVYDRLDLLQKLVLILKDNPNYHVRFLCPHGKDFLANHKLLASNVSYTYVTKMDEMMDELRQADLLYLPLTFKKQEGIRSSFQLESCLGTKSFDYMQSGVPILVQCPKEYLTYQYFKKRNAAILLDVDDSEILFERLESIRFAYDKYGKYAENAVASLVENDGQKTYDNLMKTIFSNKNNYNQN
jgi:hypothetical protein